MPSLTADQRRELTDVLGSRVALSNPLDYHTYIWGQEEPLTRCFSAMTRGPQAATLAILDYPTQPGADTEGWDIAVRAFVAAVKAGRTAGVVVSTLPESLPENVRRMLTAEGIAPMQGLDECLAAVQAASAIGMRADHVDPGFAPLPAQAAGDRVDTLDEWQSKQALAEYGLNIPEGRLVTAADAPAAAAELGFPVAVKAVGKNIVHKTEIGAVALGVSSTGAAAGAVAKMRAMSEQFLVERMVDGVVAELIVGVTRQGPFGLVLVIGTGGTYTELLSDTVTLVLPVTRREIEAALGWLQVKAILDGYRRQPRGDVAALIRAIEAVAAYAVRHADEIHEIDVNPVLVLAEGGGAVAADALIRVYRPAVATPEVIVSSSEIVS